MTDDEAVLEALRRVNAYMRSVCPKGGQTTVAYTQETHAALKNLIAAQFVEIAKLEKRLADVERQASEIEKSGTRFRGVYQRALGYQRGDQTTCKGSLWVALDDVPEGVVPGVSPTYWQLAAKGAA